MTEKLPIAVLISGYGTNLQAIINAAKSPDYPAKIALVISNKADAYGLKRAEAAGIPHKVISHKDYSSREEFDAALDAEITASGAKLVCLAGFMRLMSAWFVNKWQDRLMNIHPSLLPSFKGTHAHEAAIAAGVKFSGCTVHFVRAEMDEGPIIIQAAVPVLDSDNAASLNDKVLAQECVIYPEAIKRFAQGRLKIEGNRVFCN